MNALTYLNMVVFKMADEIVGRSKEGVYKACPSYEGPLVSVAEARSVGATRYFTGKPCPNGHNVERRVSNWKCVQCSRDEHSAMIRNDPARNLARCRAYQSRHAEEVKVQRKSFRLKNADRLREQGRAATVKFSDRIKSYKRRYYETNKEDVLAKNGAWQKANPEKVKASIAKWMAAHPESGRSAVRRRRARLRSASGNHNELDIMALFERQDGSCAACSADIRRRYDVDHVMPLSRGGSNGPENLQLLCPPCNRSKGAYTMEEWAERKLNRGQNGRNSGLPDNSSGVRAADIR